MPDQKSDLGAAAGRPSRESVRSAILDAAAVEFLAQGYLQASLSAIARRAGFTKGAIYSNFESKQGLFADLVLERGEYLADTLIAGVSAGDAAVPLPRRAGTVLADHLDQARPWLLLQAEFALQTGRDPAAASAFRQLRHRQRARLSAQLAAGAADLGVAPEVDHTRGALLVLVALQAFSVESAANPELTREEVIGALSTVFAGILAALTPERESR